MTSKEIKSKIRELKKLKKACRAGTEERLNLHRQIKELKDKLEAINIVDNDKDKLIEAIIKLDNSFIKLNIDLRKFTKEELQKHLDKIKEKNEEKT